MLKLRVQTLEEVAEQDRTHYVENKEGGFSLDIDVDKIEIERKHRRAAESRARELEAAITSRDILTAKGIDPDSVRGKFMAESIQRLSQFQSGSPEYQAEFGKIEEEMGPLIKEDIDTQSAGKAGELRKLAGDIERLTIMQATDRLTKRLAFEESADALRPFVERHVTTKRVGSTVTESFIDPASGGELTEDQVATILRHTPALRRLVKDAAGADLGATKGRAFLEQLERMH